MPKGVTAEKTLGSKLLQTSFAGGIASLLTQPLQVLKTNMIASPSLYFKDIHRTIINKGWQQYMRGGSLGVARQAYGFAIYTHLLTTIENKIETSMPHLNKFLNYSVSSVFSKLVAMSFQAPITLLKTRMEVVSSGSLIFECNRLIKSPLSEYTKGLGTSLARQSLYTLFHYNTYRYLKDDILHRRLNVESTFIPAFFAGIVAITVSQPLEVLRSRITLSIGTQQTISGVIGGILKKQGWKGFFTGYLPRLARKPINSGICWTVLETIRKND